MDWISKEFAFLIILAVFGLQTLVFGIGILSLTSRLGRLERGLDELGNKSAESIETAGGIIGKLVPFTEALPRWRDGFEAASTDVMAAIKEGDQAVHRSLLKLREQTQDLDHKMDAASQNFSRYTYQIHQGVIHPARQVSRALNAVASVGKRLVGRKSASPSPEFIAQEENFI